jgi:hypothetical protein
MTMLFTEKYGDTELRALSWKEPFASLMLHGKIETRTWDTKYRGWVLICASQKPYSGSEIVDIGSYEILNTIIKTVNGRVDWFEGKAIAIGKLVDSRQMTVTDEAKCFVRYRAPWIEERVSKKTGQVKLVEKQLWCHVYEDVQPIDPIAWTGTQGWSTVSDDFKRQINLL